MKAGVVLLLLLGMLACDWERRTEVNLSGGDPPRFTLRGSGVLGELVFYGSLDSDRPGSLTREIWDILAERMPGEGVEALGTITYGIVPKRVQASFPSERQTPRKTYA